MNKGQIEAKARDLLERASQNLERGHQSTDSGQRLLFVLQAFADASSAVAVAELVPPRDRGPNNPYDSAWQLHELIRGGLRHLLAGEPIPLDDGPPAERPPPGLRVIRGGKLNPALEDLKRRLMR